MFASWIPRSRGILLSDQACISRVPAARPRVTGACRLSTVEASRRGNYRVQQKTHASITWTRRPQEYEPLKRPVK